MKLQDKHLEKIKRNWFLRFFDGAGVDLSLFNYLGMVSDKEMDIFANRLNVSPGFPGFEKELSRLEAEVAAEEEAWEQFEEEDDMDAFEKMMFEQKAKKAIEKAKQEDTQDVDETLDTEEQQSDYIDLWIEYNDSKQMASVENIYEGMKDDGYFKRFDLLRAMSMLEALNTAIMLKSIEGWLCSYDEGDCSVVMESLKAAKSIERPQDKARALTTILSLAICEAIDTEDEYLEAWGSEKKEKFIPLLRDLPEYFYESAETETSKVTFFYNKRQEKEYGIPDNGTIPRGLKNRQVIHNKLMHQIDRCFRKVPFELVQDSKNKEQFNFRQWEGDNDFVANILTAQDVSNRLNQLCVLALEVVATHPFWNADEKDFYIEFVSGLQEYQKPEIKSHHNKKSKGHEGRDGR